MTQPIVTRVTFLETGDRLICAANEWNDPLQGSRGIMRDCWIPVPADITPAVPSLRAGEWDSYVIECYPSLKKPLEDAMLYAYESRERRLDMRLRYPGICLGGSL